MSSPFVPAPPAAANAATEPRAILRLAALCALGWWLAPMAVMPILVAVSGATHREGRPLALGWAATSPVLAWWTADALMARYASGLRLDASMVWLLAPIGVALVMLVALAAGRSLPSSAAWVLGGVSVVAGATTTVLRRDVPTDALGRIGEPWSMRMSTLLAANTAFFLSVVTVVALVFLRRRLPPDRLPITVAAVLLQGAAPAVAAWAVMASVD